MKRTHKTEVSNNLIIEYLTTAATHGGYNWDGIDIEAGTTVTCLKTIANATGLSYYRVKKCIMQLVESGRVTLTRHKCFAIITFCQAQPHGGGAQKPTATNEPTAQKPSEPRAASAPAATATTATATPALPFMDRATRRRLAREEAKAAARRAKRAQLTGTRAPQPPAADTVRGRY